MKTGSFEPPQSGAFSLKREGTPNQNLAFFFCALSLKIINTFVKYEYLEVNCLQNSKMALNLIRLSNSFWVIVQNMQNIILINNSRSAWSTKIWMAFLSFSDNLIQGAYIFFFKVNVDTFKVAHKTG